MADSLRSVHLRPFRAESRHGEKLDMAAELATLKGVIFDLQAESQRILDRDGEAIAHLLAHDDPATGKPWPTQATTVGKRMGIPVSELSHLKSHAMIEYMVWTQVVVACRGCNKRLAIEAGDPSIRVSRGAKRTVTGGKPRAGAEMHLSATNNNYATLSATGGDLCLDMYVKDHRVRFWFHLPTRYQQGKVTKPRIFVNKDGEVRFSFSIKRRRPLPHVSADYVIGVDVGIVHPLAWSVVRISDGQVVEEGLLPMVLRRLHASCRATQEQVGHLHRKIRNSHNLREIARLANELKLQRASLSRRRKALAQEAGFFMGELSARYGNAVVFLEDLSHMSDTMALGRWPRGLVKKSIEEHQEVAGGLCYTVNGAYTSQDCSACGAKKSMTFQKREAIYTACGFMKDRDLNAAANVAKRGMVSAVKSAATRAGRPDVESTPRPVRPLRKRRRQLPKRVQRDRRKTGPTPKRLKAHAQKTFLSPEVARVAPHGSLGPSGPLVVAGDLKDGRRTVRNPGSDRVWIT